MEILRCHHGSVAHSAAVDDGMRRNETGHFWCLYRNHRHSVTLFPFILSIVLCHAVVVNDDGVIRSRSVFHVVLVASLLIRRTH